MAVRLAGHPEKPCLLLLHGFPSSSDTFREVIGTLSRHCFVVAPDLPGFGASEPVSRPSFSHFADLLEGLLARFGIGSFHLYLHDFGAAAGLHLATRDQYVGRVPPDIAARIDPRLWAEDWRIMSLPGRLETQRALVLDYRSHVARFGEIATYLDRWQPPALMLWGRHDAFFDLAETLSWMTALPRMEAHILDGPHFLLETHAAECTRLMSAFLRHLGNPG